MRYKQFKIGSRLIGDSYPPLVIAEIGINHEGSLDAAIEIADAAINAGAEVIKHQTHIIEDEMSYEALIIIGRPLLICREKFEKIVCLELE